VNPVYADYKQSHGNVIVEELFPLASKGQVEFNTNGASCHGVNATDGMGGPPLIHDIDNSGYHTDGAFINAVRNGVR